MLDKVSTFKFDQSNITWRTLDWLDNISYYVYNVDYDDRIVDVIFKFAANKQVMLHRHKSDYYTFVLQGELRFYRPDGSLREVRPAGSYVAGDATGEPHTEGGGDEDAIVFFSNRNVEDALYEFLDDKGEVFKVLGLADFKAEYDAEVANGSPAKTATRSA